MRVMAGHAPQMGCFEIRRASVTAPAELLSMIWPQLDRWKYRFGPSTGQANDLAAMGLTSLLFYLRVDSRWENRWRAGRSSELQWYSLRLEVMKEIRRVAQELQ
jgi:Centromere DNA-binding protein complex CBF3 subunit, domain 2